MGDERILLADSDSVMLRQVANALNAEGYKLSLFRDGGAALAAVHKERPDLIILDVSLPTLSGIDLCKSIRSGSGIPIILLSDNVEDEERLFGLESGADDYITKPFNMRVLIARVRSILRRVRMSPNGDATHIINTAGIYIDRLRRIVSVRGKLVSLTPKEFELLRCLASHPNHVMERQILFNRVWGEESRASERSLDVHIRWLRRKVEEDPDKPSLIITVRGIGYKFSTN